MNSTSAIRCEAGEQRMMDGSGNDCVTGGNGCGLAKDYTAMLLQGGNSGPPWPDMDPMPEAWDDQACGSLQEGQVACSPAPNLEVVEALLEAGLLDDAARWLADDGPTMAGLRRLCMASWDARAAIARGRLALMRAYEAAHGAGCLRDHSHLLSIQREWNRSSEEERAALMQLHRRAQGSDSSA